MRSIAATAGAIALLAASGAMAQTTTTTPGDRTSPAQVGAPIGAGSATVSTPMRATTNATGPAAAGGDTNQAVATTGADATQPAHGSNSFTDGEARRRIEGKGFTEITGLRKDAEGVWRGRAKKAGAPANVWLDYKGNVGRS